MTRLLVLTAQCRCRTWDILAQTGVGACGYCGYRPIPTGESEVMEIDLTSRIEYVD